MFASTILTLGLVIAAPAPKEGKVEPGKLEGEWVVEKYVQGGVPEAKRSGMHMSFANDKVTVHSGLGGELRYIVFNLNTMPGNTPEQKLAVRKAVASSIDRDALSEGVRFVVVQSLRGTWLEIRPQFGLSLA